MPFMNMPFGNYDLFYNGQRVNPQQPKGKSVPGGPNAPNTPPAPRF